MLDLHAEQRVHQRGLRVGGQAQHQELRDGGGGQEQQDQAEQEAVHPGLVLLDGVEPEQERDLHAHADGALLHRPHQVQRQVQQDHRRHHRGVLLLQVHQEHVHEVEAGVQLHPEGDQEPQDHLEEPEDGGDDEHDAQEQLGHGHQRAAVLVVQLEPEYLVDAGEVVELGLEDVELPAQPPALAEPAAAPVLVVLLVVVAVLFELLALLQQVLQSFIERFHRHPHLGRRPQLGPVHEVPDEVQGQAEQPHSAEDDEQDPASKGADGDAVHKYVGVELHALVYSGSADEIHFRCARLEASLLNQPHWQLCPPQYRPGPEQHGSHEPQLHQGVEEGPQHPFGKWLLAVGLVQEDGVGQ